jgi:hypothetical protein
MTISSSLTPPRALPKTPAILAVFVLGSIAALGQTSIDQRTLLVGACTIDNNSPKPLYTTNTQSNCQLNVTIPSGKRWLVEVVHARCYMDAPSQVPSFGSVRFVSYLPGGQPNSFQGAEFVFADWMTSLGPDPGGDGQRRNWAGAIRGPFYTDLAPRLQVERYAGFATYGACHVSASGYLIDKPLQ